MRAVLNRSGERDVLQAGSLRASVALGRGGVSRDKREGDGATPAGVLPLRRILYRADRLTVGDRAVLDGMPSSVRIAPCDGWCDDPGHADYNTAVRLPHPGRCERLWREDRLYDIVGVLGWNDDPVVPGRGSAIFLHLAGAGLAPTEGCLALKRLDLVALLGLGLTEIEVG